MSKQYLSLIILILILMLLSAFLSASETALVSANRLRLRHLIAKGNKKAVIVNTLLQNLDKVIATILISNNFVNISISSVAAAIFISYFGPKWGVVLSTFIMTVLILIFCEITPKIFASLHSERVALLLSAILKRIVDFLSPVSDFFSKISRRIIILCGGQLGRKYPLVTEEEIKLMIEMGREEGILLEREKEMLHRIFAFGDTKAFEIMVPREKIIAIDINASLAELIDLLDKKIYSRIPVYDKTLDNIRGIMYVRGLIQMQERLPALKISDLAQPAFLCEPEKRVIDLLKDFQRRHIHMAIITKDGQTKGLVTLEDLLEEIVGEIQDEHEG